MAMKDYFSQHRPQTIRHFFPLGRCDCRWLRNDFSIPCAPENMSHKNIIMIHFHIWTWYTPTIVISRVCHRPINELVQNFGLPARNFGSPKTEFAWWEWRKMLGRNVAPAPNRSANYTKICSQLVHWCMSNSHYNRLTHVSKLTMLDQVESFPISSLCTW